MDVALWKRRLDLAERLIALGERIVAAQRHVVAELERQGQPSQMARRILKAYEKLLGLHITDRDRLKKDLARRSSSPRTGGRKRLN
jgi:hypothetical protein